jgi:DNA-binding CsgD family transcriptional regulator
MARATHQQLAALSRAMLELYETASLETLGPDFTRIMRGVVQSDFEVLNWAEENGTLPKAHCEREHPPIEILNSHIHQHPTYPLYLKFLQTRDPALRVARWTDHVNLQKFRETALHREFFRPLETNYHLHVLALGQGENAHLALSFQRKRQDFTEEEKLLLYLTAPHLEQSYAQANLRARVEKAIADSVNAKPELMIVSTVSESVRHCTPGARRLCEEQFPGKTSDEAAARILQDAKMRGSRIFVSSRFVAECLGPVRLREGDTVWLLEFAETSPAPRKPSLAGKGLTGRESEVLGWVAEGKTNEEIAIILGAKAGTIRKHMENIHRKLGVENRNAAAAMARGDL